MYSTTHGYRGIAVSFWLSLFLGTLEHRTYIDIQTPKSGDQMTHVGVMAGPLRKYRPHVGILSGEKKKLDSNMTISNPLLLPFSYESSQVRGSGSSQLIVASVTCW